MDSSKISKWVTLSDGSIKATHHIIQDSNERLISEDGTIIFRNIDCASEFDSDFGTYEIEYQNDRNPSRLFRLGTVIYNLDTIYCNILSLTIKVLEDPINISPKRNFFRRKINKSSNGKTIYMSFNDSSEDKNRFDVALTMIINITDDPRSIFSIFYPK